MTSREARNKILALLNEDDDVRAVNVEEVDGKPAFTIEFMDDERPKQYTFVFAYMHWRFPGGRQA